MTYNCFDVVEMAEEMKFEDYTFSEFAVVGTSTVRFKVNTISGRDITAEDERTVRDVLNNLGKWESLIRTGLQLFSELGFIHPEPATLQNYEKPFGVELYSTATEIDRRYGNDSVWVGLSLTTQERHRREAAHLNPLLQVEEIRSQLSNLPKWKAFEKTIKIFKEQWCEAI